MSTAVEVAQLVTDHLISVFSSDPNVSVERNYFPSLDREDYAKGEYKINVYPAALNSSQTSRGRGGRSRGKSRTIGITIMSRAESVRDANDNDIYVQSVMDDFTLFVESVNDAAETVEDLTLEDIEDADYMDAPTLEAEQLLATILNVTYKDY
jgi:hypothetical protein